MVAARENQQPPTVAADPVEHRPRVAVIGVGAFGEQHIRAFRDGGWELVGVADTDAERARSVATRHRVPAWFTDAGLLIDRVRPDAVTIATPAPSHVGLACRALDAGCRVLLEKPVALSTADVDVLLRRDPYGLVQPGHVLRFDPAFRALRDRVRSGAIGRVLGISARRDRECGHADRYADTHLAFLTAVHDIDLALWITGAHATRVSARSVSSGRGPQPDLLHVTVDASDGAAWSLRTAWLLPAGEPPSDRFAVYGTDGVAAVDTPSGTADRLALRAELDHLRHRVTDPDTAPMITLPEAREGIAIAEAAVASAAGGGAPIPIGGRP